MVKQLSTSIPKHWLLGNTWCLAFVLSVAAASAPTGKDALRQLLKLPMLHAEFGLRFDAQNGYVISGAKKDPVLEIERLKKALVGRPADASRHRALFEAYFLNGDSAQASIHLARSVELYRRLAGEQSENPEVLAHFGRVLDLAGREDEAEATLRRAVRIAPNQWQSWSALGKLMLGKCWRTFTTGLGAETNATPEQLLTAAANNKVPPADLERAQGYLQEALASGDRAVASAPREPEVYSDRALLRSCASMFQSLRGVLQGKEPDPLEFYRSMFPTNAWTDWEQVVALAPDDPVSLAEMVLFQLIGAAAGAGKAGLDRLSSGELWQLLSDTQRQLARRAFTRLENLGQSGNPEIAAPALEFLGAFQWMAMRDRAGAEKNLRRAVALDPRRDVAWDFLMAVLVDRDRMSESLTTAETRLKHKDSVHNRVAAAKACDRLGRLDKAQGQLEAALKLAPGDYLANLSMAILLLKRGGDEPTLKRVASHLERASRVEGRPASKTEWIEYTLTAGIFFGLAGESDSARREFKRVLELDPDNQTAKEGLARVN